MPSPQSLLTPPPMARTRTARNSLGTTYPLNPVRISTQPPPRTMMSPAARLPEPEGEQTVNGTLRLRGGCIPCPVRLLSSLSASTYPPCPRPRLHSTKRHAFTLPPFYGFATFFLFFCSGRALTTCSLKRVEWLGVLHHPHPMLLLIERGCLSP